MLVGAHVSPAGGLYRAVERGTELGAHAIQIFNQSPRAWRPTAYGEEDFARFREALAASEIGAVLIHAVYLLNCASEDPEIRAKSLASLTHSLRVGDAIGATPSSCTPARRRPGRSGRRSSGPARSSPRRSPSPSAARCISRTPPAPAARSGAPSTSSRR